MSCGAHDNEDYCVVACHSSDGTTLFRIHAGQAVQ